MSFVGCQLSSSFGGTEDFSADNNSLSSLETLFKYFTRRNFENEIRREQFQELHVFILEVIQLFSGEKERCLFELLFP
jgi:hypothetical protein